MSLLFKSNQLVITDKSYVMMSELDIYLEAMYK